MTRELNSLLARLEDVVERMPDCFNTYEFAQKLALQHQREFFAAGHSLAEQEGRLLRVLHEKIAEALAGSDKVIEGGAAALRDALGGAGYLAALASQALSHPLHQQQNRARRGPCSVVAVTG